MASTSFGASSQSTGFAAASAAGGGMLADAAKLGGKVLTVDDETFLADRQSWPHAGALCVPPGQWRGPLLALADAATDGAHAAVDTWVDMAPFWRRVLGAEVVCALVLVAVLCCYE